MRRNGLLQLLVVLSALSVVTGYEVRFDGHAVLSCKIHGEDTAAAMVTAAEDQGLDVWSHRIHQGRNFHVQVGTEQRQWWEKRFGCGTYIEDLQKMIDEQELEAKEANPEVPGVETLLGEGEHSDSWYTKYHRFDDIVKRMQQVAKGHPTLAKFVPSIGKSREGRDIPVVHITGEPKASLAGSKGKPQIWFNGGQHAREWIAPATVHYIYERLLADYKKKKPLATKLLNKFEFVVAPVINPDGYEYSFTGNRLWRKNRSKNADGSRGVDLNRNWGNHWGQGGASTNPKAIDYQGPSEASEPEVQACQKYIQSLPRKMAGVDFHSYGEMILRSKGWTKQKSADENLLRKMAHDMKQGIAKVKGTKYKSEVAAGLYPTTGSTDDWMSEQGKMWGHGWTVELPGRQHGHHGFLLPASAIKGAAQEMYHGFSNFALNLTKEERKRERLGEELWQSQWRMSKRRSDEEKEKDELEGLLGSPAELSASDEELASLDM